jgi:hypothetical protein
MKIDHVMIGSASTWARASVLYSASVGDNARSAR